MNFAEQDVNAKGIAVCSKQEHKMMCMREPRIRLFMQVELEACGRECKWLLRCHHCIVNNFPDEYCPPMPLPISTDYAKNLMRRWEMPKKGVLLLI